MKKYFSYIFYLLISIVIGSLLLIASYAIPNENVNKNIALSSDLLWHEMDYPNETPSIKYTSRDNFTDTFMLNIISYDKDGSLIQNAFANPFLHEEGAGSNTQQLLDKYIIEESYFERVQYPRYWHGYIITLKPLLYFFDLSEIRLINSFIQLFLLLVSTLLIYKRFDFKMVFTFFITIFFLKPNVIANSFQLSTIYYIFLLSIISSILFEEKLNKNNSWDKLFLFTGILIAYFDFLTYPLLPLGALLVLYILMHEEDKKKSIINIIKYSFIFSLSYLTMWFSKWILSSLILNENIILDGLTQVSYRTSAIEKSIFLGLLNNFGLLNNYISVIVIASIIIFYNILILKYNYDFKLDKEKIIPLLLISLIPIAWYIITNNHSFLHNWMTYREIGISIFSLLSLLAISIKKVN